MKLPKIKSKISKPNNNFFLLLTLTISIFISLFPLIQSLGENELETIAKTVSRNLQSFTWKHVVGFNFTNILQTTLPTLSKKNFLNLTLLNITPFITSGSDTPGDEIPSKLIENDKETSITFLKILINYKFDVQLDFSFINNNMTVSLVRKNIFAKQICENIKFKKDFEDEKFILDNFTSNNIQISSLGDLNEIRIFSDKKENFEKEVKILLQKNFKNYLEKVIFYYPSNNIQKKFYNMVIYLIKTSFIHNIREYYFRSIDYIDIDYLIDEDYVFRNVSCQVTFIKQPNQQSQQYSGKHINIDYVKITKNSVTLGDYTTDFRNYIDVISKFTKGMTEDFQQAFEQTTWD